MMRASRAGDSEALQELRVVIYPELRRLARHHWSGERRGHTLQPTAIAHEAFLRLFRDKVIPWDSSQQFFLAAGREIRRVLVDHARKLNAEKRGAGVRKVTLGEVGISSSWNQLPDLIDLERALEALAAAEPRAEKIITLKFYAGCTIAEIGELLGVSHNTVDREWEWARAWLLRRLGSPEKVAENAG
jgi:RNA polymerase sigma factor (TIGR02999 family)